MGLFVAVIKHQAAVSLINLEQQPSRGKRATATRESRDTTQGSGLGTFSLQQKTLLERLRAMGMCCRLLSHYPGPLLTWCKNRCWKALPRQCVLSSWMICKDRNPSAAAGLHLVGHIEETEIQNDFFRSQGERVWYVPSAHLSKGCSFHFLKGLLCFLISGGQGGYHIRYAGHLPVKPVRGPVIFDLGEYLLYSSPHLWLGLLPDTNWDWGPLPLTIV